MNKLLVSIIVGIVVVVAALGGSIVYYVNTPGYECNKVFNDFSSSLIEQGMTKEQLDEGKPQFIEQCIESSKNQGEGNTSETVEEKKLKREVEVEETSFPTVEMKIKDFGDLSFTLDPMNAPQSTYNFAYLASSGFYDGLVLHRIEENFVAQGGDPTGSGSGGPGYNITGEFESNGYSENKIVHELGNICWARSTEKDSAGSQFYINLAVNDSLNKDYACFGKMTKGQDLLPKFNEFVGKPLTIESVKIDTKGVQYPKPEMLEIDEALMSDLNLK